MDFTIVKVGTTVSTGGNVAIKMQHKVEGVEVPTAFGTVVKNRSLTYYIGVKAGTVTVKEDDIVPLNLDDYNVKESNYTYTDETSGETITVPCKWLYLK